MGLHFLLGIQANRGKKRPITLEEECARKSTFSVRGAPLFSQSGQPERLLENKENIQSYRSGKKGSISISIHYRWAPTPEKYRHGSRESRKSYLDLEELRQKGNFMLWS